MKMFITEDTFNLLYNVYMDMEKDGEIELTVVDKKTDEIKDIVKGKPEEALQELKFRFNVVQYVNANK